MKRYGGREDLPLDIALDLIASIVPGTMNNNRSPNESGV